ncbi:MAG: GNAT family N-acetyltransferase [Oscillospiraceae bacterium]|nr:GNAT family N-acetyltransferase [Oscillospiraceae bacterium]
MKDPKIYLERDFLLHADMLNALLDEKTETLYSEEDGVMLKFGGHGPYAITAANAEAMTKMAKLIEKEHFAAVVRPFKFLPEFFAVKGRCGTMPCYQASYRSKEPVPEPEVPGIEIRPLSEEHIPFVMKEYEDDEEYITFCVKNGMLGAFDENGNCAGFIGTHGEGSMGLLKVLPEYRRRGIGIALEARMLNKKLREGKIPHDHVVVGNEKSMALQRKIGMGIADNMVTWVFNDWE